MQVWQHIPEHLDPIAFTVGFFSVRWYALLFLAGFIAALLFCLRRFRREPSSFRSENDVFDLLFILFLGGIIGGRAGYVLLYNADFFLSSPISIIMPYDFGSGVWTGLSGMSFHGGLIGAIAAFFWFVRKKGLPFWETADFVAPAIPLAIFFGRLGNFFNLELYGRTTEKPWGMIFPSVLPVGTLRHPSALYEAFLEGLVLFAMLLFFQKREDFSGKLFLVVVIAYSFIRFGTEFFREPDSQIGVFFSWMSLGQGLSVLMAAVGITLFFSLRRRNNGTM